MFSNLVGLHLDIGISLKIFDPIAARCLREGHAAKASSSAINLECLCIRLHYLGLGILDVNDFTSFSIILGGCQFLKLRSLMLKIFEVHEDELLPFILASPKLGHLLMDRIVYANSIEAWAHFFWTSFGQCCPYSLLYCPI